MTVPAGLTLLGRKRPLVVMTSSADRPASTSQQFQDEPHNDENHADGPQDRNRSDEANQKKDDTQDDHCGSKIGAGMAYQCYSLYVSEYVQTARWISWLNL